MKIQILPLFHDRLSPKNLEFHLNRGSSENSWKEMAEGLHPIEVENYRETMTWLCNGGSIPYIA